MIKKHVVLSEQVAAVLAIAGMLVGCATIFGKGGPAQLSIRSTPEGATVLVVDEAGVTAFEGNTPTVVQLVKKKGYMKGKDYTITISKDGYQQQVIIVDTKANGWYIGGNIAFGGLIGWLIVDPLTGAMWKLDPKEIDVTLAEGAGADLSVPGDAVGIALLEDVPSHLRDKMVPIAP